MSRRKKILLMTGENVSHKDLLRNLIEMYDEVITFSGKVSLNFIRDQDIWGIVSDRNGHILNDEIIDAVEGRAFNSHPSLLPLHRGWQPIFFSVLHDTPVGVSIHQVNSGLDTGALLYQQEVILAPDDRLDTLYFKCRLEIVRGWAQIWSAIRSETFHKESQNGTGCFHSRKEFEALFSRLPNGWMSDVEEVRSLKRFL